MSKIGELWDIVYGKLCGVHPYVKPWHYQWLFVNELYRDLKHTLSSLEGRILDVGCGKKPYRKWLNSKNEYLSLDVTPDSEPDILVMPVEQWQIESESFDAVICTQVLEHVAQPEQLLHEIHRILKPNGVIILTIPFIYHEHDSPNDYWRWTKEGISNLLKSSGFLIIDCKTEGRIGNVLSGLLLSYIYSKRVNRIIIALFLPVWILVCMFVNLIGVVMNIFDTTNRAYTNIFVKAKKITTNNQ